MNIAAREPIATRELRQAARQKRGPILLGVLGTAAPLLALLISSGMTSPWSTPSEVGRVIFETMLTLALAVVVLVGVTGAASSVASEREGQTWEALQLSGLRPAAIVRGKFLGTYAQAVLYIFALAPSAALGFLVGGVSITEVVLALGLVGAVGAVAVLFGLAISSFARTARGALGGSLVATLVVLPIVYGVFMGLGALAGSMMGDNETRGSTWLAHAIVTAPFEARSFVFFVVDPLIALAVPGWLVFEITKANLSDASDDRSTGLKRWYLVGTLLLVIGAVATIFAVPTRRDALSIVLVLLVAVHLGFSALVFGGEPLGPSRRVLARGARTLGARILGPGIAATTVLHATVGVVALLLVFGVGASLNDEHANDVSNAAGYAIAFHLFIAGVTGALAVRFQRPVIVRGLVVATTLVLTVIPLVIGTVGRAATGGGDAWRLLEAASPLFPIMTVARYGDTTATMYGQAAMVGYALLGVLLVMVTAAGARSRSHAG